MGCYWILANGDRLLTIHQNINQKQYYLLDLVRPLRRLAQFLIR
nr:MAG TPA: hypothetical protein [Caudoviricetes sp.]DAT15319.1 MAG TPA: hypothetical protein [Caudoviricetes sp.]